MTFKNFDLHEKILTAIGDAGYSQPTDIQSTAIPVVNEGFDLRASAQTGTGKTAAFLLPALNKLTTRSQLPGKGARVLILVPTRELAMQVAKEAEKYSKHLKFLKTVCIVGGVPYHMQQRKLSKSHDILIATPGRLIDYMQRGKIDFSRLELLVLDEADRMLDMGFVEPVVKIAKATPKSRQTLLFSATLRGSVMKLSEQLMNNPKEIVVHAKHEKHENIVQKLHYADDLNHKRRILTHVLNDSDIQNAIIFTSTKRYADQLVGELKESGYKAAALHGDMRQRQRTRTISMLKQGKVKILVATDVAARGIDIQSITHVINFDLPHNPEDYVHRIGRTGRAGNKGLAISIAANRDQSLVKSIEKFTGQLIEPSVIKGLEPRNKPSMKSKTNSRSRFGRSTKKRSFSSNRSGFKRRGSRRSKAKV